MKDYRKEYAEFCERYHRHEWAMKKHGCELPTYEQYAEMEEWSEDWRKRELRKNSVITIASSMTLLESHRVRLEFEMAQHTFHRVFRAWQHYVGEHGPILTLDQFVCGSIMAWVEMEEDEMRVDHREEIEEKIDWIERGLF